MEVYVEWPNKNPSWYIPSAATRMTYTSFPAFHIQEPSGCDRGPYALQSLIAGQNYSSLYDSKKPHGLRFENDSLFAKHKIPEWTGV